MTKSRYTPTVQGRASIATWDLSVSFRTKEQAANIIKDLLELEILRGFTYEEDLVTEPDGVPRSIFTITIDNMHWAKNLVIIAKIFKKHDYKD